MATEVNSGILYRKRLYIKRRVMDGSMKPHIKVIQRNGVDVFITSHEGESYTKSIKLTHRDENLLGEMFYDHFYEEWTKYFCNEYERNAFINRVRSSEQFHDFDYMLGKGKGA